MKNHFLSLFVFLLTMNGLLFAREPLTGIHTWAYQLQNIRIDDIVSNATFELIVIDYSADGSNETRFSAGEISRIRQSGKKAMAYLSIGEAETYRYYWQPSWDSNSDGKPDKNAPVWLGPVNPDWEGNYKVRFWYDDWQSIIFGYVDKIVDQGFDGIYMDIIDAYYYWAEEVSEKPDADALMIQFVLNIRKHLNETGHPDFYMIPQNGEYILVEPHVTEAMAQTYLDAVDAIGVEDVFFQGDEDMNNPYDPDAERLDMLAIFQQSDKPVFSIEYLTDTHKITRYIEACATFHFIPVVANRELDQLPDGIDAGTERINSGPDQCVLYPNFPNPFNSTTRIRFDLNTTADVRLAIYNALGKLVFSEQKGRLTAGQHHWCVRLDNQPSGIYVAMLQANSFIKTQKLILMN